MLKYLGQDSWSRPVYEDEEGTLVKDVNPVSWSDPLLHTSMYNSFDGEPDCPYHGKVEFNPERVIWY